MHERSLVAMLMRQIDEELQTRQLHGLSAVRLEIGEFCGIEPALLESAFEEMTVEHWGRKVILLWEIVALQARCQRCAAEFPVDRFRFVCPACNHGGVDVIAGENLRLISLSVEQGAQRDSVQP